MAVSFPVQVPVEMLKWKRKIKEIIVIVSSCLAMDQNPLTFLLDENPYVTAIFTWTSQGLRFAPVAQLAIEGFCHELQTPPVMV